VCITLQEQCSQNVIVLHFIPDLLPQDKRHQDWNQHLPRLSALTLFLHKLYPNTHATYAHTHTHTHTHNRHTDATHTFILTTYDASAVTVYYLTCCLVTSPLPIHTVYVIFYSLYIAMFFLFFSIIHCVFIHCVPIYVFIFNSALLEMDP
jgi:hypothetical protein